MINSPKHAIVLFTALTMFACAFLRGLPIAAQDVTLENDITYGKAADVELKLDLARPVGSEGTHPAIMFLCGNSWGDDTSEWDRQVFTSAIQKAARYGYVAVTVDVRYTRVKVNDKSIYVFPAQLCDAKCAVRWLRANAKKYNIDPDRIGVLGWSSGGNLALLLALTKPSDGLEGDVGNLQYSSSVQTVVSLSGPTNLLAWEDYNQKNFDSDVEDYLGGTPEEVPQKYKQASPVSYFNKEAPPILLLQGEFELRDDLPRDGELLNARLNETGTVHELVTMKGRFHESFWDEKVVWDFFKKYLQGGS